MRLFLFRHGIAVDRGTHSGNDADRPLTERGRMRTRKAALGLRWLGLRARVIWTSPLLRAKETAKIVALSCGRGSVRVVTTELLNPDADPSDLIPKLRLEASRLLELVLVSHAPHQDRLLALLLESSPVHFRLRKAGVAILEIPKRKSDPLELVGFHTPSLLRRLGRAQESSDDEGDS